MHWLWYWKLSLQIDFQGCFLIHLTFVFHHSSSLLFFIPFLKLIVFIYVLVFILWSFYSLLILVEKLSPIGSYPTSAEFMPRYSNFLFGTALSVRCDFHFSDSSDLNWPIKSWLAWFVRDIWQWPQSIFHCFVRCSRVFGSSADSLMLLSIAMLIVWSFCFRFLAAVPWVLPIFLCFDFGVIKLFEIFIADSSLIDWSALSITLVFLCFWLSQFLLFISIDWIWSCWISPPFLRFKKRGSLFFICNC